MILKNIYISILVLGVSIFFLFYSQNFKLDASSDTLILQNDSDFKFFNYYNKIFPSKNFLILAIKSNNEIDDKYLRKIKEIKEKLLDIKGIKSIFSIIDIPILLTNKLKLSELTTNQIETLENTKLDINLILDEFSNSPIFKDQIISRNKKVSSIIIYLKKDNDFIKSKNEKDAFIKLNKKNNFKLKELEKNYSELKKNYNKNRNILISNIRKEILNEKLNYKYFLGGIDMIANDTLTFVKNDIINFGISVFVFIFIILLIIFKSIKWVIIPIISTAYSIICMIGLIGFMNWEITAISSNFISLMLILSISMCIHIINNYRENYNNKIIQRPLGHTLKIMFWPCFYTSLTTIVAFGSLLFSDIRPLIDFGKIMIIALIIILITSFTILPLLISFFPKIDNKKIKKFLILQSFLQISIKHKFKIYFTNLIIFIISLYGIYNLNVENSFINYFKEKTEIYQGMKLIDEELGGTTPLDIIITFKDIEIMENSLNLNTIDNEIEDEIELELDIDFNDDSYNQNESSNWFTSERVLTIKKIHKYLENREEIGKVQSLYSLINMAELINKDTLSTFELSVLYNEIPENYKEDLINPYLSINDNMTKISMRIKDSKDIKRQLLIKDIKNHLNKNYNEIKSVKVNGLLVLYNNMLQSLFSSQIKSFVFVLISIFIMFIILFKSIKLSVIGIIPNIFASTFILGLIGILNIPLDIMTITIAAITIGIAVDNTIHYLYKIKKISLNEENNISSLENSHKTVGQAVFTTSLTIAFGFSVLCLSNFIPTILFGLFTSLAMIIAMLGVLITLPALLIKIKI